MIKGLWRLRGDASKHQQQHHNHPQQPALASSRVVSDKSQIATFAPKQIIRAIHSYTPQSADELAFVENDFLYVIDEVDAEQYRACNPLANAVGLVPRAYFEVIQRQESVPAVSLSTALHKQVWSPPEAAAAKANGHSRNMSHPGSAKQVSALSESAKAHSRKASKASSLRSNHHPLAIYGLVLYDFVAERDDELDAKAGESIIIIAQSNEEWFVAKPIGRLGGPGLIPVSYIEVREVDTDEPVKNVHEAIALAGVPQVEEWKRRAAEYKASSIPLGRFEDSRDQNGSGTVSASGSASHLPSAGKPSSVGSPASAVFSKEQINMNYVNQNANKPYVVSARVEHFAVHGGRYWYLVVARMSNGKYRKLCRYYQDFYDLQIKLLDLFPEEAGRRGKTRTLPFMPGPLTLVNHAITSQRRASLDEYVQDLLRMKPKLSQSPVVQELFALRPGDMETDYPSEQLPVPPEDSLHRAEPADSSHASADASVTTLPAVTTKKLPHLRPTSASPLSPNMYSLRNRNNSAASSVTPTTPGYPFTPTETPDNSGLFKSQGQDQSPGFVTTSATNSEADISQQSGATAAGAIKVKVFYGEELIAIRIPGNLPFSDLYNRIAVRLNLEAPVLYTNNSFQGKPVKSDASFNEALNGRSKIVLYVSHADSK